MAAFLTAMIVTPFLHLFKPAATGALTGFATQTILQ
jgi:hypothetical protein